MAANNDKPTANPPSSAVVTLRPITEQNLADMQAYQVHPGHKAVLDYLRMVQEAVAVVDFEKT